MSVVASKLGNADEASLAHWKSPAAVPNASLAEGDQSDPELMCELIVDSPPLHDEISVDAEEDELSNRLPINSRIPILDSRAACCVELTVPRLIARATNIIREVDDGINLGNVT